jgi:FHA domain
MSEEYTLEQLFEEYTFQRLKKVSADQALQLLVKMRPTLPEHERQQLSKLIRQWEIQQQTLHQAPPPDIETTQQVVTIKSNSPSPSPLQSIHCATCGTPNPPESKYCYSCGNLLAAVTIPNGATGVLPDEIEDSATFGNFSMLMISVQGYDNQPLQVNIPEKPLMVGRSDASSSQGPDVDLSPFKAQDFGVSRFHAILKRENQTVTLVDQGSVNHTYINGEKLHPHEVRVVRDGDEVRFGRLVTRFKFHRQLRRLDA